MLTINLNNKRIWLDVRDPAFYSNPYPTYWRLQDEAPIFYWENYGLWGIVRHEDISTILRDRRFGRQILHVMSREALGWEAEREDLRPFFDVERFSLLELEPPDHTRLRGLVQKAFMARQIERLRPRIAALAHRLLDEIEPLSECDLLPTFATPIPVIVIAEMLGVPAEMSDKLLDWSHAMVRMYELTRTPEAEKAAVAASRSFASYLRELIAERRRLPRQDLISALVQVAEAGDRLSEDEMVSTCILLLNAGHEATVNVIGNGVKALLEFPHELARWQKNERLTKTAVAELLRYDTPLHQFNRWVLEDLEYNGVTFKQGDQVALMLGAGNWDTAVFHHPHELNLSRHPNPHLSFSSGVHYCLGAPLARLELETVLPILLARLPNLRLAAPTAYQNTFHFHALKELNVVWR